MWFTRSAEKALAHYDRGFATIFAAAIGVEAPGVSVVGYNETLSGAGVRRTIAPNHNVLTGLDVLEQEGFAQLKGKRVGPDHQSNRIDRQGRRNMER